MSPAPGTGRDEDRGRVRIPADVERPDKLLAGLTARQLAILGVAALFLWAGYAATRHLVPVALYGAVAVPVGALATFLALGRMEGVPAERWVLAAWRQRRAPRRLVPAPEGVRAVPGFLGAQAGSHLPAPLRLPLASIGADGVVDLGPEGLAVICRARAVTFALRTPQEQEALVAGFARFLHSLAEPVQVLVRAERLDISPAIDALVEAAPGLPDAALERAARDHAGFLAELTRTRTLLHREVLVVLRQPAAQGGAGGNGAARLVRRAAEAVAALAAAGVTVTVLDGPSAAEALGRCLDPAGPPPPAGLAGGIDEPVTLTGRLTSRGPAANPHEDRPRR